MYPVAAPCFVGSGAIQVMASLFGPVPATPNSAITGAFGAYGPTEAVVSVLVADQALVPPPLTAWTSTSIAALDAKPDRSYGLLTPVTTVQVPAPEGTPLAS